MLRILSRYPFLTLFSGLLVGILLASAVSGFWLPALLALIALAGLMIPAVMKRRKPYFAIRFTPTQPFFIVLLAASMGVFTALVHRTDKDLELEGYPYVAGTVVSASQGVQYSKMLVRIDTFTDEAGNIVAQPKNAIVELTTERFYAPDTRLIFRQNLRSLDPDGDVVRERFAPYLRSRGVAYTQWVPQHLITVAEAPHGLRYQAYSVRQKLIRQLESSSLSSTSASMLAAMALGHKDLLDEEDMEAFRYSGLSHLLALSGMHVGIVAWVLSWLLFPLMFFLRPRWRWLAVIALIWLYVWLTGWYVSALRACIMSTLLLGALVVQRRNTSVNAILASAFIIVLFDPLQITTAGFQLSFAAALLLVLSIGINPIDHHSHPRIFKIFSLVAATLIVTAGTMALSAYYFHNITPASFVPNLLAGCLLPFYLGGGIIYILLLSVGLDVSFLAMMINKGTEAIVRLAHVTASSPSLITDVRLHAAVPVMFLCGMVCLILWLRSRRKLPAILSAGSFVVAIAGVFLLPVPEGLRALRASGTAKKDLITMYDNDAAKTDTLQSGSCGLYDTPAGSVGWCSADMKLLDASHPLYAKLQEADYLVLGRGAEIDMQNIAMRAHRPTVVLLPSLRDAERDTLTTRCTRFGLPYHDIAADGPFLLQYPLR